MHRFKIAAIALVVSLGLSAVAGGADEVPYPEGYDKIAVKDMEKQANEITANLKKDGIETLADREIVALIAYLQRLGKDIKAEGLKAKK